MKNINRFLVTTLSIFILIFGFVSPVFVNAATAPSLGVAAGYSIYGDAGVTNTGAGTSLWGNVGDNNLGHPGLIAGQVAGVIDAGVGVGGAALNAYGLLDAWGSDGAKNLSISQTVSPGVHTLDATQTLTGTITLSGAGVYIFRSDSAYTIANDAQILLTNGADPCNVFWQIPSSMVVGTNAHMEGTIITNTGLISFATGATLRGRALAHTQVTLDSNQITEPICTVPSSSSGGVLTGTINVVKVVINDSGGTKTVNNFPLFVNGVSVNSGVTSIFPAPGPVFTVSETNSSGYTQSFSGDCDANGQFNLNRGDNKFCIITNNDIGPAVVVVPPLIEVVKTAVPLSLPNGPGSVIYTYTLRNIGTVPATNITMVGDTCSPIVLVSGDVNSDAKLDLNETWIHTCSTILPATHTNTVVATGWANGISAVDIASATVVVGVPIIPPLIHVVKTPNIFLTTAGGAVTYNYTVTNPGTAPLHNVNITDDKCTGLPGRVVGHPGDLNKNDLLESNESWFFTCRTNLFQTTTNTATVTGTASGLMATDFALATVVVVVPKLPKTGFPAQENSPWNMIILAGISIVLLSFLVIKTKQAI